MKESDGLWIVNPLLGSPSLSCCNEAMSVPVVFEQQGRSAMQDSPLVNRSEPADAACGCVSSPCVLKHHD